MKNINKPLVVLGAGGTGGHIFPAQALAAYLLDQDFRVVVMTDQRGEAFQSMEAHKDFQLISLSGSAMTSVSLKNKIFGGFRLLKGVMEAYSWFKKNKPNMVIGFGGFASIPPVMAAMLTQTAYMIHEQNATLGRANRLVASKARYIATNFLDVQKLPKTAQQKWVGTPLREAFLRDADVAPSSPFFHLLILGGSQGAKIFNDLVYDVVSQLPIEQQKKLKITQQVRKEYMDEVQKLWEKNPHIDPELSPFFSDVASLMKSADLYMGRAGAGVLSEALACHLPVIMIPYPHAADQHQYYNALNLQNAGCGLLIEEEGLDAQAITDYIHDLMNDLPQQKKIKEACAAMAKTQATKELYELIKPIANGENND